MPSKVNISRTDALNAVNLIVTGQFLRVVPQNVMRIMGAQKQENIHEVDIYFSS